MAVWYGIRFESGEHILGTPRGVLKARTIRARASHDERWDWEFFKTVRGTPWEPVPGSDSSELKSCIKDGNENSDLLERPRTRTVETIPRGFRIEREDVRYHGITPNCQGCVRAMGLDGRKSRNHKASCRARFLKIFSRL